MLTIHNYDRHKTLITELKKIITALLARWLLEILPIRHCLYVWQFSTTPRPPAPPPSVALCPIRTAHYAKVLRLIVALRSHNLCLLWCFNVYVRTNEKSTAREKNDEREGGGFKTFPPRCSFRDLQFSLAPSFVRLHQPRTWKKLVIACLVAD